MRRNIFLKSTLRQPVRTLFLLLLCAAAGVAFFSQVLQYAVVGRAVDEIGGYYRAVGRFSPVDPYTESTDVSACLAEMEGSNLVSFVDQRRTGIYTMQEGEAAATYGGAFRDPRIASYYVTAKCGASQIDEGPYQMLCCGLDDAWNGSWRSEETFQYRLTVFLSQIEQVEGLAGRVPDGVTAYYFSDDRAELEAIASQLTSGERLFCKLYNCVMVSSSYVSDCFWLQPFPGSEIYACPVRPDGELELDAAVMEAVREDMELISVNTRSGMVYTTKDQSAIAFFSDSYTLLEGRLLTRGDDLSGARNCVIRRELAATVGVGVGDTLELDLWKVKAPGAAIHLGLEGAKLSELERVHETFTVVGILAPADGSGRGQGLSMEDYRGTIYIPDSTMPEGWNDQYASTYYDVSFMLRSADDQKAFARQFADGFLKNGMTVEFMPTGWDNFKDAAAPLRQSLKNSALLFGGLLALTTALTVLLYVSARKKDMARLRALGVKRGSAAWMAFWPLALVTGVGYGAGAAAAYGYGMEQAAQALQELGSDAAVYTYASPALLTLVAGAVWLVLLAALAATLAWVANRPVLAQLQAKK